jgi:hypothetical protein
MHNLKLSWPLKLTKSTQAINLISYLKMTDVSGTEAQQVSPPQRINSIISTL